MLFQLYAVCALLLFQMPGIAQVSKPDAQERLNQQIRQLITGQPAFRVFDWISFQVSGRVVTLQGSITDPSLKDSIERSVQSLEAVDAVQNDLILLPRLGDDIGIRINAYWRIYGHPEIRNYLKEKATFSSRLQRSSSDVQRVLIKPIHLIVQNGHLSLEGELELERVQRIAEEQASAVLGIRSISNNILVTGAGSKELEPIDFEADPWWTDSASVDEPVLRVENPSGRVRVQVKKTDHIMIRRLGRDREVKDSDVNTGRFRKKTRVRVEPSDRTVIDLEIDLPYGYLLEVETISGPILVSGLVKRALLKTVTGKVELTAPWNSMRLNAVAAHKPDSVMIPATLGMSQSMLPRPSGGYLWTLRDMHKQHEQLYGEIHLNASQPASLTLYEQQFPVDSPVRMHWEAQETIRTMFRLSSRMHLIHPAENISKPGSAEIKQTAGIPRFTSDVRLVELTASVLDSEHRPVTDLDPEQFEVLEDGVSQDVRIVQDTEARFNLILLLDCSTSTIIGRKAVMETARNFVLAARPVDRVGIYVLSGNFLHVVSELTSDRSKLLSKIELIPRLSGGTPLYDAIALAYAEELSKLRWERNALIVISDGIDNDLLPKWNRSVPSRIPFEDLLRASAEMNSVIYPIFLEPGEPGIRVSSPRRKQDRITTETARERMNQLAANTGGRVFKASSIRELDPVYELVVTELRSVYTLGYYPSNQTFDGNWRSVLTNINLEDVRVRTRPGYYAW